MASPEELSQKITEKLQGLCNDMASAAKLSESGVTVSVIKKTINDYLKSLYHKGIIHNFHIDTVELDDDGVIHSKIMIKVSSADVAVIGIGARPYDTKEPIAIQKPRDANYEDRWNFVEEELMEDEISLNEEKQQQEGRADSRINELKDHLSKRLPMAWKRLLR